MPIAPLDTLICPHDGARLAVRGKSLACPHNHTFDLAKEGYVNLLSVQDKASKDPGDSREMVAARRRFLETGAYAPIADAVAEATRDLIAARVASRQAPFDILDAGCGEGYYLQTLAKALAADAGQEMVALAGIDISKWAVRVAAKRSLPVTWAVASNKRPPFVADSVDLVLCMFGFPVWPGFASVQPVGGHVLMVDPGPDHLLEMRRIIYSEVKEAAIKPIVASADYVQVSERRVVATARLPSQTAIADLLTMTPHDHRASVAGRAALAGRSHLDVTVDVMLRVFRRDAT